MAWPGHFDDPDPDIIGAGEEDGGPYVRWRWLTRPVIIAAVLLCAAVTATVALVRSGSHPASSAPVISSTMADGVQGDGVFAGGSAAGRTWRMAVQNIAGTGGQCQPAVTFNGMDADPLYPGPARATPVGDPAFMAPGASLPGAGFAFIKVPAGTTRVWLDPGGTGGLVLGMRPVSVTSCGERFRLVGFGYPLAGTLRIHETVRFASTSYTAPSALSDPRPSLANPQVDGLWLDTDIAHAHVATATLATGQAFGQGWSIRVAFGTAGDCFTLSTAYIDDSVNARPELTSLCGPVATVRGPDTVVALGLGSPAYDALGVGYAMSVSPRTVRLTVHLSDGGVIPVTPVVVAGRKYAAFFVTGPARLTRLSRDNATGEETAGVQDRQEYGYTQFRL